LIENGCGVSPAIDREAFAIPAESVRLTIPPVAVWSRDSPMHIGFFVWMAEVDGRSLEL
jgi:hypothetical protein